MTTIDLAPAPAPASTPGPPPSTAAPERSIRTGADRSRRPRLRPGWPLTAVLVGYPVLWLVGVAEIAPLAAAVVMAVQLWRDGMRVRRGFGIWLLFLVWVAAGALLLQVDAPGAIPGGSAARFLTYGYRYAWYLTATVTMVYVYTRRRSLSATRLTRAFGCLFLTVEAGGFIGTLAPRTDFPSLIELVLPHALDRVQFVHDLVHPAFAQLYTVDGVLNPRVSAPFAYTNDWGLNFACLLPFFVYAWLGPGAGWRKRVAPLILLAAVYPVVESQNRGLWLALLACGALTMIRLALLRSLRVLVALVATVAVAFAVIAATSLGAIVEHRLVTASSDEGRQTLAGQTVRSVSQGSPIAGFGSTRNVQGSFYSIAGGDTANCARCSPPALGTQGHFWLLIFSTGIGGLLLYLGFVLYTAARAVRLRSPLVTLALAVVVAHLITMFVYDTIGIAMIEIFAALGLLWIEQERLTHPPDKGSATPGAYALLVRRNVAVFAGCAVLAAGGAGVWRVARGVETTATTTVVFAAKSLPLVDTQREQTLDSIAQMLDSSRVVGDVGRVTGLTDTQIGTRLTATAAPNSRVLHIHFVDARPARARAGADAAARGLIAARADITRREQSNTLAVLRGQRADILRALTGLDTTIASAKAGLAQLAATRGVLLVEANTVSDRIARVSVMSTEGGVVTAYGHTRPVSDRWLTSLVGAELLGVAAAAAIAYARNVRGRRLGRRSRGVTVAGLTVLARLSGAGASVFDTDDDRRAGELAVLRLRRSDRPPIILGMPEDRSTIDAARQIEAASSRQRDGRPTAHRDPPIVLVAGSSTRDRDIELVCRQLRHRNLAAPSLVLIGQRATARHVAAGADKPVSRPRRRTSGRPTRRSGVRT